MTPLADTSVWVDGLRYGRTPLPDMTGRDQPIGYTEPVLMELLSGARNDDEESQLMRLVIRGELLAFDAASDFRGAADIYRFARRRGITPNSQVDCMIVAVAARHRAALMTLDAQQRQVAELLGVQVI